MSRLASLSPAALRAMFSTDSDDTLIAAMTLSGPGIAQPIRLCDGYTHKFERLTSTSMTVTTLSTGAASAFAYAAGDAVLKDAINADPANALYGVMSGAVPFLFLPFQLTLPTEEQAAAPRCSVTIHDVTRLMVPVLRTITSAPSVGIDLVLSSTPGTVEAAFPGFKMGAINYSAESISAELTVDSLATEPFPAHTFTPSYFPGLF
jgi:hypothetical protein